MLNITPEDLFKLRQALPHLPEAKKRETAKLLKEYDTFMAQNIGKMSFLDFIKHVYPDYKVGPHHLKLIQVFEDIAAGKKKRVVVNIAPRHGKSELISYLAPAWFLGKFPHKKVIMSSHTADLAINFGRRVRNLVGSDEYKGIFPQIELQSDSKSASRWGTNFNGEYFAIGVGGALAGRGADLFIIDDPHSEQDAKQNKASVFLPAWEWFQSGPIQRLMPGGAIIVVMTRWSKLDLTGQIVSQMERDEGVDQWEVIEFPAIKDDNTPLWPEFWTIEELLAKKATLDVRYWNAQYLQQPTSEEGALIKREWWSIWDKDRPPECEFIIMALDAAQETNNRADFNALTTWGVFFNEEVNNYNIILLNAIKKRMEFPELKALALAEYKEWQPDAFIVEKKSNGAALYQEMRRMGIPVGEFTPGKGQDKISRVNAISDLFASGIVWAPEHRWAREVIEECNDFPSGTHDDLVDSCLIAGTLILLQDGTEKPIETITRGDYVMTPKGPRRVLEAKCTGYKQTYSITEIVGSKNHPVFTLRGWIPLLWLQKGDIILSLTTNRGDICVNEKIESRLGLTGFCIKSIVTGLIMNVLGDITFCIGIHGFIIMEKFQKAAIYITKMKTQVIMIFQTSKCSLLKLIGQYIKLPLLSVVQHLSIWHIWKKLDHLLLNGMGLKKGKNGIKPTPLKQFTRPTAQNLLVKSFQWRKCVAFVSKYLYLKTLNDKLLALKNAIMLNIMKNGHSEERKTPLKEIAGIVLNHTRLYTKNKGSVVPSVSRVVQMPVPQQIEKVYNLTVEDTPMYYANGVLVHNCTMALMRFRQGGFIRLPSDEYEEDDFYYKSRRKAAYY